MASESESEFTTHLTKWLDDVRGGDKTAFRGLCSAGVLQRLYLAIAASLPQWVRARVGPEDVLQEVLRQAWEDIGELKDVSARGFHRWVSGIARNRVADVIRRETAKKRDARHEEKLRSSVHPGDSHTPSRSASGREQRERIVAILDGLKDSHRDVIKYRILEGYTGKETAELMGTTPENINTKLHRALKVLRDLVDEHGIDPTIFRPL